jgi:hypothetical protein
MTSVNVKQDVDRSLVFVQDNVPGVGSLQPADASGPQLGSSL